MPPFILVILLPQASLLPFKRQNAAAESRCVEAIGTCCVAAMKCAKSAWLYFKAI